MGGRRAASSLDTWVLDSPARERAAPIRASCSRTPLNPAESGSSTWSESATWASASTTALPASTASSRETVKTSVRNRGWSPDRLGDLFPPAVQEVPDLPGGRFELSVRFVLGRLVLSSSALRRPSPLRETRTA
ncbi:hypothetical protein SPURM210S_01948 [Streptomyces purpurascens]